MGGEALGEPVAEHGAGFQSNEQCFTGQHVAQDAAIELGSGDGPIHVRNEPLPSSAGRARAPELAVVEPRSIVAV